MRKTYLRNFSPANRSVASFSARWCTSAGKCRCFYHSRAAGDSGVHATDLSGSQLHLDTRLLGVGRRRLLLGAGHVGGCSSSRAAVDSGLLGLG